MQKWEYCRLVHDNRKVRYGWALLLSAPLKESRIPPEPMSIKSVDEIMVILGYQGWELVCVDFPSEAVYRSYLFKRPLEEE